MRTAIMGFGNPVRSDDGLGIYVVKKLKEIIGESETISIFDMGTNAFEILFGLKGHQKIILVDAVLNTNEPIGTMYKVPANEVLSAPENDPMVFLHGMKWNQALSYAKKILVDEYPDDIQVYLVAIQETKYNMELSAEVQKAGDKVIDLILDEMKLINAI